MCLPYFWCDCGSTLVILIWGMIRMRMMGLLSANNSVSFAGRILKFDLLVGRNQSKTLKITPQKKLSASEFSIFIVQQKYWYHRDRMDLLIPPD